MFYMLMVGLILAVAAIVSGQILDGVSLLAMVQPGAFIIVFGGTVGAVVAQSSPKDFLNGISLLSWLFRPPTSDRETVISEIVRWSRIAYRDGSLQLDKFSEETKDPLLKSGLEMIVDQVNPENIRDTLLMDIHVRDARLKNAARMWESAGGYAPTIGILGSVIGLLHVMNGLNDTSKLGPGIASAFVATIYGLVLANLLFLPLATKLRAMIFELTLRDELRVEGLAMIAQNKKPRLVERTLLAAREKADNITNIQSAA